MHSSMALRTEIQTIIAPLLELVFAKSDTVTFIFARHTVTQVPESM